LLHRNGDSVREIRLICNLAETKGILGEHEKDHLFTLEQSVKAFRQYQELITARDRKMAECMEDFDTSIDVHQHPLPEEPNRHRTIKQ
jgi:hypothetical protein